MHIEAQACQLQFKSIKYHESQHQSISSLLFNQNDLPLLTSPILYKQQEHHVTFNPTKNENNNFNPTNYISTPLNESNLLSSLSQKSHRSKGHTLTDVIFRLRLSVTHYILSFSEENHIKVERSLNELANFSQKRVS